MKHTYMVQQQHPNGVITVYHAFHWKFWAPLYCIGGNVYFGYYHVCKLHDGHIVRHTPEQHRRHQEWVQTRDGGAL